MPLSKETKTERCLFQILWHLKVQIEAAKIIRKTDLNKLMYNIKKNIFSQKLKQIYLYVS